MMMLLLLLVIIASAVGVDKRFSQGFQNCSEDENDFLNCMKTLFDTNKDNVITRAELEAKYTSSDFYSGDTTVDKIMEGDCNGDNQLDMTDWNHPNRTFFKSRNTQIIACFLCRANNVKMDKQY